MGKSERELYLAAAKLPTEAEQRAYLSEACGNDQELRNRVEKLLDAKSSEERNLLANAAPASGIGGERDRKSPLSSTSGDRNNADSAPPEIERYRIIEEIGQGGMGTVYMAEQREPVRRKVALKVIKRGMDSEQVVARFEAERQALALMNHPNIAGVLDAGMTKDGRPFFVMELVRGIPINEYCDRHKLTRDERLKLFQAVCQAVQHAHQKGIIHRDLKPSNILVELHDVSHVPKVIDFGVAKATSQRLTDKTLYTLFSQMIGTPLYMSPEQAELSGLDVDTRSDIYSLGVVLYELLTGTTPFDIETFKQASLDEVRRIIREDEPLKPSQKISTLNREHASTIAQKQGTDLRSFTGRPVKELDWIVVKTLEKDRSRRYESASALANDLGRYLSDEPVLACPPSVTYRLSKFAIRHRRLLLSLFLVFSSLIAATATSIVFVIKARVAVKQTRIANGETERINHHLVLESQAKSNALEDLKRASSVAEERFHVALNAVDSFLVRISDNEELQELQFEGLRENLLNSAVPFLEQLLEQEGTNYGAKLAKAEALLRIGRIQHTLGQSSQARGTLDRSFQTIQSLGDATDAKPNLQRLNRNYYFNRGSVEASLGNHATALDCLYEAESIALELDASLRSPSDRETRAKNLEQLSRLHDQLDEFDKAADASKRSSALLSELVSDFPSHRNYARGLIANYGLLAKNLARQGNVRESAERYRKNISLLEKLIDLHPNVRANRMAIALAHNGIAGPLTQLGELKDAIHHLEQAVEISSRLVAAFPRVPSVLACWARTKISFGVHQFNSGKKQQARDALLEVRDALEAYRERHQVVPELLFRLAHCYGALSRVNLALGKPDLALERNYACEEILRRLVDKWPKVPKYRNDLAYCLYDRGWLYFATTKFAEAIATLESASEVQSQLLSLFMDVPAYAELLAQIHNDIGHFLVESNRRGDAIEHTKKSYDLFEELYRSCPNRESSCFYFLVAVQNSEQHQKAIEMSSQLMRRFPQVENKYRRILANAHYEMGKKSIGSYEDTVMCLLQAAEVFEEYFASFDRPSTETLRLANCYQLLAIQHAFVRNRALAEQEFEKCLAHFESCIMELGIVHPTVVSFAYAEVSMCCELASDSRPAGMFALGKWAGLFEKYAGEEEAYTELFQQIDEARNK